MPHVSEDTKARIASLVAKLPRPRKAQGNGARRVVRTDGEREARAELADLEGKYKKLLKLIAATPSMSALKRAIASMDDADARERKAKAEPEGDDEEDETEDEEPEAEEDEDEEE